VGQFWTPMVGQFWMPIDTALRAVDMHRHRDLWMWLGFAATPARRA